MAITVNANVPLQYPRLRILVELDLASGTKKVTTADIYPGGALGTELYERRLLARPEIQLASQRFSAFVQIDGITLQLDNSDGIYDEFLTGECRGRPVRVHFFDVTSGETTQNVFCGEIAAFEFSPSVLSVTVTSIDVGLIDQAFPPWRVNPTDHPNAPELQGNAGALGSVLPYGSGIGRAVPARLVYAPDFEEFDVLDPDVDLSGIHYDWIVGRGNVSVKQLRENETLLPYQRGDDFDVLTRAYQQGGKYYTAVRFYGDPPPAQLLGDIERVLPDVDDDVLAEWKWGDGFYDDVDGLHARADTLASLGATTMTTGNLTAGPTGFWLGAVRCGLGAQDYLIVDPAFDLDALAKQTFTAGVWIKHRMSIAADRCILLGAKHDSSGSSSRHSWALVLNGTTLKLYAEHTGDGAMVLQGSGSFGAVAPMRWRYVEVVRTTTAWNVYVDDNPTPLITVSESDAITYGGTEPMVFCGWKTGGNKIFLPGCDLGPVRMSQVARTQADRDSAWFRMQRNLVEFMKEVLEDIGFSVSSSEFEVARATASTLCDGQHLLKVDPWVTEETTGRNVLDQLASCYDIRLTKSDVNEVVIVVPQPATVAQMTLGIADYEWNNASLTRRFKSSAAEAVKTLKIRYRLSRDNDGDPKTNAYEYSANVLSFGRTNVVLEMPFVDDHQTADILRHWNVEQTKRRDEVLQLTANHEARILRPGHIVRIAGITYRTEGHFDPADFDPTGFLTGTEVSEFFEVQVVAFRADGRIDLSVVPYAEAVYRYRPSTLNKDAVITSAPQLDLGDSQVLLASSTPGSLAITYDLQARKTVQLKAAKDLVAPFTTPYGGTSIVTSVPDGGVSHAVAIRDPDTQKVTFTVSSTTDATEGIFFEPLRVRGTPRVLNVKAAASVRKGASSGSAIASGVWFGFIRATSKTYATLHQTTSATPSTITSSTDYEAVETTWERNPYDDKAWRVSDLRGPNPIDSAKAGDLAVYFTCTVDPNGLGSATLELDLLTLYVLLALDAPASMGFVRVWAIKSDALPSTPDEADPSSLRVSLAGAIDVTETGTYWLWVGVYDSLGRLFSLFGPKMVVVS